MTNDAMVRRHHSHPRSRSSSRTGPHVPVLVPRRSVDDVLAYVHSIEADAVEKREPKPETGRKRHGHDRVHGYNRPTR